MKLTKIFSVLALLMVMVTFAQKSKTDYSMYPKAKNGFKQKIITLKTLTNEDDYEVELFVGKKSKVDNCNRFFLAGEFAEKNVEGWGYNYYDFKSDGNVAGTMMGCLNSKEVEKTIHAQTIKTRYNSKLPIVVYVPKGFTLEYRIWKADKQLTLVK